MGQIETDKRDGKRVSKSEGVILVTHHFRREELYELVWTKPVSKLAKELGVSDVGLTKACRRAEIPVPGSGYWAKVQHGKKVAREPLMPAKAGSSDPVVISPGPRFLRPADLPTDIRELVEREESLEAKVHVTKTLRTAHPLIRSRLSGTRRDGTGGRLAGPGLLAKNERRRLRILSSLLTALEKRGHKILADQSDPRNVALLIAGERVNFSLTERHRQFKEELSPEERRSSFNFGREYRWQQKPTGELVLRIQTWSGAGIRTGWRDLPRKPLEERLNDITTGLLVASAFVRRNRLEREEAERRRRKEERRRLEEVEARRQEGLRRAELMNLIARWRQAGEIRAYVEAIATLAKTVPKRTFIDRLEEWRGWALAVARDLDPTHSDDPLSLSDVQSRATTSGML